MPRGICHRHGQRPCTCAMGNLYRFVEPVLLFALKEKGQTYGYELIGSMQKHMLTDAEIDKAALYRTLKQLEMNGMVVSEWDVSGSGPARHLYELTPAGNAHLNEWVVVLRQLGRSIERFVDIAEKSTPQTSAKN